MWFGNPRRAGMKLHQFRDGDRLRNGAGCGKYGQSFLRDKSNKGCDNRPRGACRVRPNLPAYRRAGDEPCQRIVREPLDFAFHARADSGVQPGELSVGVAAYFDLVGHGRWRGFQGLNLPATSSRRASRNSAMTAGFCAVSQS